LDKLANYGYLIITQDSKTSKPYIRHQLTTDVEFLEFRELSIGINVDNISYFLKNIIQPFIGKRNINADTLSLLNTKIVAAIEDLKANVDVLAGPQLIDAKITKIAQDPTLKDQVRVELDLVVPYPLNVINVHLII